MHQPGGEGLFAGQIDGGIFAAVINLDIEGEPVAFVEAVHSGTFNRADVHKAIGSAIIPLDETKALRAVEELHFASSAFAGQLTTGAGWPLRRRVNGKMLAGDLQLGRRNAAVAVDQREGERLTGSEAFKTGLFDRADVDKHVFAAVIAGNEAKALVAIEKLYAAGAFADDLSGHLRTRAAVKTAATAAATARTIGAETAAGTATAVTTAAATAAAEAATVTITAETAARSATAAEIAAAETAAARGIAEAATAAAVEVTATKIVALSAPTMTTLAATAAFPVKTHAPTNTRIVRPAQLANHPERTGLRRHESGKDTSRSGATYRKSVIVRREIAWCLTATLRREDSLPHGEPIPAIEGAGFVA
jgi:hypothetical protein